MTFQPLLPLQGYSGWRFLNRTLDRQIENLAQSPSFQRDAEYFRSQIDKVEKPEDLVADFRLLRVALTAFGLQDDLPNRAFIRRVLADGTTAPEALSNRLADKRYKTFSEAFGFGENTAPNTRQAGFADRILSRFQRLEFERAVGAQSEEMRLGLNAMRELPDLVGRNLSERATWFSILGNPPLRSVFETALGLPKSIGKQDLELQLNNFRARARATLGITSPAEFGQADKREDLMRAYLTRSQITLMSPALSGMNTALTLLGRRF